MARVCLCLTTATFLLWFFLSPNYKSTEPSLQNYGVKNRSLGGTLLSKVSSRLPMAQEISYRDIESWKPYIIQAAAAHIIPEVTVAAVLYEEAVHRKPIDLNTFGPAQLGYGELRAQGLPLKRELLEDPEMSVWILTRKLSRLRKQYGSLENAIILHNGYEDFLEQVKYREKDQRLLIILNQTQLNLSLNL